MKSLREKERENCVNLTVGLVLSDKNRGQRRQSLTGNQAVHFHPFKVFWPWLWSLADAYGVELLGAAACCKCICFPWGRSLIFHAVPTVRFCCPKVDCLRNSTKRILKDENLVNKTLSGCRIIVNVYLRCCLPQWHNKLPFWNKNVTTTHCVLPRPSAQSSLSDYWQSSA